MIRSLEALKKFYPGDLAIQTAVSEWSNALQL
jgi:hypothetical protein